MPLMVEHYAIITWSLLILSLLVIRGQSFTIPPSNYLRGQLFTIPPSNYLRGQSFTIPPSNYLRGQSFIIPPSNYLRGQSFTVPPSNYFTHTTQINYKCAQETFFILIGFVAYHAKTTSTNGS